MRDFVMHVGLVIFLAFAPIVLSAIPGQWIQLDCNSAPLARFDHIMLDVDKYYFLLAGVGNDWEALNDTWVFDKATNLWSNIETISPPNDPLPPFREHAAVFDPTKNLVYIVFGKAPNNATNDIWVLDLNTMKWTHRPGGPSSPPPRFGHSAVLYNEYIYIFGGSDDSQNVLGDMWSYNTGNDTWYHIVPQSAIPYARDYHSANIYNNYMILFGGYLSFDPTNDLWAFNFDTEEWTLISLHTPLIPRSGHATMFKDNQLIIFGGELHNETGYSNANDLWSWNADLNSWTQWSDGSNCPEGRIGSKLVNIGDGDDFFLFGGMTLADSPVWTAETWYGDSWYWLCTE